MTRLATRLLGLVVLTLATTIALVTPVEAAPAAGPQVTFGPGAGFSAEQEQKIRQEVAAATVPVTVRAMPSLPEGAAGSPRVHAEHLAEKLVPDGQEGVVLVFAADSLPAHGVYEARKEATVGAALVALKKMELDPHSAFVELVEMLSRGNGYEVLDRQLAQEFDTSLGSGTDEPSTSVLTARWLIIGGLVLLIALVAWFRGRALLEWWRRRRRTSGIEEAAVQAREAELADRAKADVLAFGAAIDAEKMDAHDALQLWQLALDDYHQASALFDERSGPADDERIIALCEQGRDRLRRAQR